MLALLAHDPGRDWSAVCIGRARSAAPLRSERMLRRPAELAVDLLADLVAMYDEGRREPLPLPTKTSYRVGGGRAHATAIRSGRRGTGGGPTAIPGEDAGAGARCGPAARAPG